MKRLVYGVAEGLLRLATACGILLTLFVAAAAGMRYLAGAPLPFTEELVGLLFAALVFLALPYVTLHNQHIEVTLLAERLPGPARRLARALSQALVVLFCAWFGMYAYDFAALSMQLDSRSDIGGVRLWPWMALLVLACVLMGAFTLYRWLRPGAHEPAQAPPGA
ncbi:TRAP transporter small permease [Orrella sp. JC864]|uniref:TRAP transporter small permease n=1 Tax=Orrella sp. JC864 TaxID=3120298 RepID=UPI00300A1849